MTNEIEMTISIRMEPELRDAFAEKLLQEHRPAAQVLCELIRDYVEPARERGQEAPAAEAISAAERQRREAAVNFARASVGLEGFKPHAEDEALSRRYAAGEITIGDAIKAVHAAARER